MRWSHNLIFKNRILYFSTTFHVHVQEYWKSVEKWQLLSFTFNELFKKENKETSL